MNTKYQLSSHNCQPYHLQAVPVVTNYHRLLWWCKWNSPDQVDRRCEHHLAETCAPLSDHSEFQTAHCDAERQSQQTLSASPSTTAADDRTSNC